MLRPDVIDLREFYHTPLGRTARRLVRAKLRLLWPSLKGQRLLGLGYATPYMRIFEPEAERVLAAMPGPQGVNRWPRGKPGRVMLVEEEDLPLPNACMDRILLVHALENAEHARNLLREVWRVLTPQGRLMVVVPNRRGFWAHIEATPFGSGHPYTSPQLTRQLRDAQFSPTQSAAALWLPPSERAFMLSAADAWERTGQLLWSRFSGVLLVEAEKQVYAATPLRAVRQRQRVPILGTPQPA